MDTLPLKDLCELDLRPSEEEREFLVLVNDFVNKELAPVASELEKENRYPHALVEKAKDMGLFGLMIPREFGGVGASYKLLALIFESISRVWMGYAGILGTHSMMCSLISEFGTREQKTGYLPGLARGEFHGGTAITEPEAGSDVQAISTSATRVAGGYRLDGRKSFLTNGASGNLFVIVAKTDSHVVPPRKGISLFLAEKSQSFYVTGHIEKLGYRPVDTVEVVLDQHHVRQEALLGGQEGQGFEQVMSGLEGGRINIAARAVGVARAAMEEALTYSQQRQAFGQQISQHQAVQLILADMATKVEAARLLTLRAAVKKDQGGRSDLEAGMAKLFASEICAQVCFDSMRVHGGYGYTKDFLVERLYRDAPLMVIGEGTNEIQRLVIARNLLKRNPID